MGQCSVRDVPQPPTPRRTCSRFPRPCCHALLYLQDAVKVMAKSLVRNRHAVNKLFQLKSQLQAVSLRIAVRWRGEALGKVF